MLIRVPPMRQTLQALRSKDPERDALRRAVRAAIVVPLTAGFAFVFVGGHAAPLYALLGAFWLRALRAETTDHSQAVEAAQPLVTVAANLAQLELVSIATSETVSAATSSAAE